MESAGSNSRTDTQLCRTHANITGFVLAGGRSSRLGQDKVLLPWHGRTLLDHAVERLQKVCGSVRVCADREDLKSSSAGLEPLIRDAVSGAGPLGGIVAALKHSQTSWNFFLAVDVPLLPVELLEALAERTDAPGSGALCILPQVDGRPQPLCGVYHRSLVNGLRGALEEGKYKILLALEDALRGVSGAQATGLELFDARAFAMNADPACSASDWFLNINSPEDWLRANELNSV